METRLNHWNMDLIQDATINVWCLGCIHWLLN